MLLLDQTQKFEKYSDFTTRKQSLGQGNFCTPVCHSFCSRRRAGGCLNPGEGVCLQGCLHGGRGGGGLCTQRELPNPQELETRAVTHPLKTYFCTGQKHGSTDLPLIKKTTENNRPSDAFAVLVILTQEIPVVLNFQSNQ